MDWRALKSIMEQADIDQARDTTRRSRYLLLPDCGVVPGQSCLLSCESCKNKTSTHFSDVPSVIHLADLVSVAYNQFSLIYNVIKNFDLLLKAEAQT